MRLLRYLAPYRLRILAIIILIFLQSLSSLYLPHLMSQIVDNGVLGHDMTMILQLGAFMLFVSVVGGICSIAASYYASKVSMGFGKDLRSKVFSQVEHYTLHEISTIGTASLITRTTNDITQVQQLVNMMLRMMVMAPLTAIGGIIMAITTDAHLSLVIVGILPVLAIAIFSILGRATKLFKSMQVKIDTLNRVLREGLTGVRVIRSFNRGTFENHRFDVANLDLTSTSIQVNKIMALMFPMMMLIVNLSTVAIVWFGGLRVGAGQMPIGGLMAFIQYVMQILFSVMMVSMMSFMIPRASASATRINEVLETPPEITDAEETKQEQDGTGLIEFRNVSFYYPGAEQPALQQVSFTAHAGDVTAIIGGTGSGKSTLLHLIARFYDVTQGQVLVDGVDVRDLPQERLRAKMGYVPQQAVLFSGSIKENIRYGKADATDDEICHAADVAQATEFISQMPEMFDAEISQGGTNVSGGQKQRLSIARALVRRPVIYLFDDSFSALDFKTDAALRAALKPEVLQSTVFIVAQRVATVMDADQIIVLDEGNIVGIGDHETLFHTCKAYQEIVASQLAKGESA